MITADKITLIYYRYTTPLVVVYGSDPNLDPSKVATPTFEPSDRDVSSITITTSRNGNKYTYNIYVETAPSRNIFNLNLSYTNNNGEIETERIYLVWPPRANTRDTLPYISTIYNDVTVYDYNGTKLFNGELDYYKDTSDGTPTYIMDFSPLIINNVNTEYNKIENSNWYTTGRNIGFVIVNKDGLAFAAESYCMWGSLENKYGVFNNPINGHLTEGMNICISDYAQKSQTDDLYIYTSYPDTTDKIKITTPQTIEGIINIEINPRDYSNSQNIRYTFDFEPLSINYEYGYCGDYYLMYINSMGGVDTFLIEGNVYKYDSFERSEYFTNPRVFQAPDTKLNLYPYPYITPARTHIDRVDITPSYVINTGWLTEKQAEVMVNNLLSSSLIWIHNIKTDQRENIILTDNKYEYKSFKNGKRLVQYTLNAQVTQNKCIVAEKINL